MSGRVSGHVSWQATLQQAVADRHTHNLYRQARILPDDANIFCSNDYLGLAQHADIRAALVRAADVYGVGSTGSHLISGHHAEHHALAEELAAFTGRERALVFSTGYMANMGCIDALSQLLPEPVIASDALNHASLIDGCRISKARVVKYAHADVADLQAADVQQPHLIVTDGLFSMDGDVAPLVELADYAQAQSALLMVDDAHGLGVLGAHGGGCCELFGLTAAEVPVLVGTFGKALGTSGAFVAGDADLIDYLVQQSRPYIYTTALPPAVAAATRQALRLVQQDTWRRTHLQALIQQFRRGVVALGLSVPETAAASPIQPVLLGDVTETMQWSQGLAEQGYYVTGIRPPTVPPGTSRLRVTLSAAHQTEDVDGLLQAMAMMCERYPLSRL